MELTLQILEAATQTIGLLLGLAKKLLKSFPLYFQLSTLLIFACTLQNADVFLETC